MKIHPALSNRSGFSFTVMLVSFHAPCACCGRCFRVVEARSCVKRCGPGVPCGVATWDAAGSDNSGCARTRLLALRPCSGGHCSRHRRFRCGITAILNSSCQHAPVNMFEFVPGRRQRPQRVRFHRRPHAQCRRPLQRLPAPIPDATHPQFSPALHYPAHSARIHALAAKFRQNSGLKEAQRGGAVPAVGFALLCCVFCCRATCKNRGVLGCV